MDFFDARFGGYLVVAALLIVTPGPDTALVTRHALLDGRRAASFTTFGIGAGSLLWAMASVLGRGPAGARRRSSSASGSSSGRHTGVPRPAQSDRQLQEHQASYYIDTRFTDDEPG